MYGRATARKGPQTSHGERQDIGSLGIIPAVKALVYVTRNACDEVFNIVPESW